VSTCFGVGGGEMSVVVGLCCKGGLIGQSSPVLLEVSMGEVVVVEWVDGC
jgi:hypothetical protein